jgi:GDP-4-dehydro-6-deoxy-D-mannose reductase
MRVLVTGASGFIGRAFCAAAPGLVRGIELIRAGRAAGDVVFDLLDQEATGRAIASARPDVILHLAGISSSAAARADLARAHAINVGGVAVLAEATRREAPDAHFILAGSGLAYGASFFEASEGVTEDAPLRPLDAYAATKAAAEAALAPAIAAGARVTILRFFNMIGPAQSRDFAVPAFAHKIAEIERGLRAPVIDTTRLDEARDFVDIRDAVRAISAVLAGDGARIFNVASECTTTMTDVLGALIDMSPVRIEINETRGAGRPVIARGSPAALTAATGWRAEIPLPQTLADILAAHRGAV